MTLDDALAVTRRIATLFPTTAPDLLKEILRQLEKLEWKFEDVNAALGELYFRESKFFDMSALAERMTAFAPVVDPLTQRNSAESQQRDRIVLGMAWALDSEKSHGVFSRMREDLIAMAPADRAKLADEFIATLTPSLQVKYRAKLDGGDLPTFFVCWCVEHHQAQTVSREMALDAGDPSLEGSQYGR